MGTEYGQRMPLLDKKGRLLRPGWATADVFEYNKERLRPHGRRKEWEVYQLGNRQFMLRILYGHVGYAGAVQATLVDFETGERYTAGTRKLFPGDGLDLDFSPGQPHSVKYEDGEIYLGIHFDGKVRRLVCRSEQLDVKLRCTERGEGLCIAAPYSNRQQFYYGYKKFFPDTEGYVRLRGQEYPLDAHTFLQLDSSRCALPYAGQWVRGGGTARIGEHTLGIHIGWGCGSDEAETENVIFWDGKAHKLDRIWVDRNENPMEPWRFQSNDGRFKVRFEPGYDDFTKANYLLVRHECHRLFGTLRGTVYLDNGKGIKVDGMPFRCEHAVNRW